MTATGHSDAAVAFSRHLSAASAAAMGAAISFSAVLFALGAEVLRVSGDEAPLALGVAGVLYLPLILCLAERASAMPASAGCYELARAGGSTRRAFAVGWLMLGGLWPLAGILVQALIQRLEAVLVRLFGIEVASPWLVVAVVPILGLQVLLASSARWHARTVLVWGGSTVLAGLVVWAFVHQPPSQAELPPRQPLDHWLASVALLAAGLWGLEPILHHRPELRRGDRVLVPATLAAWLPALAAAAAASQLLLQFPDLLAANWLARLTWSENRLELLSLVVTIGFCATALYWVTVSAMRLIRALTRDGFLPAGIGGTGADTGVPRGGLALFLAGVVLLALAVDRLPLAGAASLGLLSTAAIVILPQVRDRKEPCGLKLPLHPLLPVLTVATAVFLSLVLPVFTLRAGLVWALLGGLYFVAYARRGGLAVRRREYVVGETEMQDLSARSPTATGAAGYRVLTWAADDDRGLTSLVRLGTAIARARGGELLVLAVVHHAEQRPMSEMRDAAEEVWLSLNRRLARTGHGGVPVRALVRIAPSIAGAILETAAEYRADFLVLAQRAPEAEAEEPVVAPVFAASSRPMAVLHGRLTDASERIVAASAGGPHAPTALELADALAAGDDGAGEPPVLLAVAGRRRSAEVVSKAAARTAAQADIRAPLEPTVIEARAAAEGILNDAGKEDVLILGASIDRLLGQTVLSGLAAEVAEARTGPTIVVKRREQARRFWLRRLWQASYDRLPTLEVSERAEVFSQMRHQARASVDYYVQIFLASAIAILGLRLDSGAVIIGAMLVAPLMSPILGVAHGIVQGNPYLIRRGGASTAKGVGVAIAVGIAAALLLPKVPPTHEMLARGHPSLLDLLVALAAGAAAAYAVSRKSVAPALPGVAISVALVPPLCVVGHAIGASDFPLAGGALLLFLTNLAGIILIGATVFLLLGFRPSRSRRGRRVGRAMLLALAAILLLAVPLGFETLRVSRLGRLEARIAETLRQAAANDRFRVVDYTIERQGEGFTVITTIHGDGELSMERIEATRRRLSEAAGVPVEIHATLIAARVLKTDADREPVEQATE